MAKRILRRPEVKTRTGLSATQIDRMEKRGEFPRRIKLTDSLPKPDKNGRLRDRARVGWDESEVDRWIEWRQQSRPASALRSGA